jgi:hypothetical protein
LQWRKTPHDPGPTRNSTLTALHCRRGYQTDAPTVYGDLPSFYSSGHSRKPRRRGETRNRACFREPEQALMSRIRRFNWTCTSRPSTLILHREATILTKTEPWDRIPTAFKEKSRLIYRARMISAAMPGAGALQTKGVNSDGQGEGIYRND